MHPLRSPPDKSAPDKSVLGPTMKPLMNENVGGSCFGTPTMYPDRTLYKFADPKFTLVRFKYRKSAPLKSTVLKFTSGPTI